MSDKLLNYAAQTLKLYANRMRIAKDDRGFPWSMTDSYTRTCLIEPFGYLYYAMHTFQFYAQCCGAEERRKWVKARTLWGFEMQHIA